MIKKAFGILAVTLMLLVVISPMISSSEIKDTVEENQQQSQGFIYKEDYPGSPIGDPDVIYYEPGSVLVIFKDFVDVSEINGIWFESQWYNIIKKYPEENYAVLEVFEEDMLGFVEKLNYRNDIECAGLNTMRYLCSEPNDELYDEQWGLPAINCDKAWDVPRNMALTWLTIIDSGIDADHEDFKGVDLRQRDFYDGDNIANDNHPESHGTKVAGVAVARMNNGKGIAGVAGDAPTVEILKVFNTENKAKVSDVLEALIYCTTVHKAPSVILMSYGGFDWHLVEEVILARISAKHESLLIASVGNGCTDDKIYCPGRYKSTISVGAVDQSLYLSRHGGDWGSNYNQDKREVDLVAPGEYIWSTADPHKTGGEKYVNWTGKTSAAAALVAGVAMLWYGARAHVKNYRIRRNEQSTCRLALYNNARPVGDKDPYKYGYGLVDAYATIPRSRSSRELLQIDFIERLMNNFPFLERIVSGLIFWGLGK
jgi:hypothetical protein